MKHTSWCLLSTRARTTHRVQAPAQDRSCRKSMLLKRLFNGLSLRGASSPAAPEQLDTPSPPVPSSALEPLRFVVATRGTRAAFFTDTPTGRSLVLHGVPPQALRLFTENTAGLATVYNIAIEEAVADPAVLVFVHDDVHLLDFDLADRVRAAVKQFHIAGLAGNKRRVPLQPAWSFVDDAFTWDDRANLSGAVGHGSGFPPTNLSRYGQSKQAVKLLDGVMLIAHSKTLADSGLRFDERFDFHLYDMDFCRQAEQKGLVMGTWPISAIHESKGTFGSESWRAAHRRYVEKWQS